MLSEKLLKELNLQLNRELFSSYFYLSMATYFETAQFRGFAHWMNLQSQEEYGHSMKFYRYIQDRGGVVKLEAIEKPKQEWDSPLEVFEEALKHEQEISGHINNLSSIAIEEKDHGTHIFLQWFVTEQIEEENTVNDIVFDLQRIGKEPQGLFMMDRELSKRTTTPAG